MEFYKLIGLTSDEIKLFDKNNDDVNSQSDVKSNEIITMSKKKTSKSKIKTKITNKDK